MLRILVVAALVGSPADNAYPPIPPDAPPNSSYVSDAMPPVRFMGDAGSIVAFVTDLNQTCGTPPKDKKWAGCRRGDIIYLPNPCPFALKGNYAWRVCHELAHRNGWPAYHGD